MKPSQNTSDELSLLNEQELARKALELQESGKMPSPEQFEAAFEKAAKEVLEDLKLSKRDT